MSFTFLPILGYATESAELFILFDDSGSMRDNLLVDPARNALKELIVSTSSGYSLEEIPLIHLIPMKDEALVSQEHPFTSLVQRIETGRYPSIGGSTYFLSPLDTIRNLVQQMGNREARIYIFTDGQPDGYEVDRLVPAFTELMGLATVEKPIHIQFTAFERFIDATTRQNLENLAGLSSQWENSSFRLNLVNSSEELQQDMTLYNEMISLQQKVDRINEIIRLLQVLSGETQQLTVVFSRIEGLASSPEDVNNAIVVDLNSLLDGLASLENEYASLMTELNQLIGEVQASDPSLLEQIPDLDSVIANANRASETIDTNRDRLISEVAGFHSRVFGEDRTREVFDERHIPLESREGSASLMPRYPNEPPEIMDVSPTLENPSLNGTSYPDFISREFVNLRSLMESLIPNLSFIQDTWRQFLQSHSSLAESEAFRQFRANIEIDQLIIRLQRIMSESRIEMPIPDILRSMRSQSNQAQREGLLVDQPDESVSQQYQILHFSNEDTSPLIRLSNLMNDVIEKRNQISTEFPNNEVLMQSLTQLQEDISSFRERLTSRERYHWERVPGLVRDVNAVKYWVFDVIENRVIQVTWLFVADFQRSGTVGGWLFNQVARYFHEREISRRVVQIHRENDIQHLTAEELINDVYPDRLVVVTMNGEDWDNLVESSLRPVLENLYCLESNSDLFYGAHADSPDMEFKRQRQCN